MVKDELKEIYFELVGSGAETKVSLEVIGDDACIKKNLLRIKDQKLERVWYDQKVSVGTIVVVVIVTVLVKKDVVSVTDY